MNTGTSAAMRNYMVPASGQTHGVTFEGPVPAQPTLIDWRQYTIDNAPFQPQGVLIDNTQGTAPLIITFPVMGWTVTCPAGNQLQTSFPAANGQNCYVQGDGVNTVTMIFVDYPVLPSGTQVSVSGTVQVNIASPNPLPVQPNINVAGVPYQFTLIPSASTFSTFNIPATNLSGNVAPTPNTNLKKLRVSITGEATLGAAAEIVVTVTLNGVTIFTDNVFVPAVAGTGAQLYSTELDFSNVALPVGAAGTLVTTLSAALATGVVRTQGWFA